MYARRGATNWDNWNDNRRVGFKGVLHRYMVLSALGANVVVENVVVENVVGEGKLLVRDGNDDGAKWYHVQ